MLGVAGRSMRCFLRSQLLRGAAAALGAVVLVGCGSGVAPSPSSVASPASPSPALAESPSPGPTFTTAPTIPADLPLTASIERDGIRVSVTLERNPMPAGEPTLADMEVKNVGTDDVTWLHDGCAIPVGLHGEMAAAWRPGTAQSGIADDFKTQTMRDRDAIVISFAEEQFIGKGSIGCADIGVQEQIGPGKTRHQRARWNGMAYASLGPAPGGPVALQVWAGYYYRTKAGDPGQSGSLIQFEMPAWITNGKSAGLLDPPEIVDAALRDPTFLEWLRTKIYATHETGPLEPLDRPPSPWSGREPLLWFDPDLRQWHVEVITYCGSCEGGGTIHGVLIDPVTGVNLGIVDHPWDGSFAHHGF
jgi:hypothetical protein